jgi:hypothetical protein
MKNILKLFCIPLLLMVLASCSKKENIDYLEKSTPPVFTHLAGDTTLVLTKLTEKVVAARFGWTNPDFQFTTGVSSQGVTYTIQADTTGKHFTTEAHDLTSVDNDFTLTATQGDFNKWLSPLGLQVDSAHKVELRVKASVKGSAASAYSNIIPFTITPYLDVKVPVPVDGTLWALGSAFASSWDNPMLAPYNSTQQFTKVSDTKYELVVNFVGGGNFKLIQAQGNWDTQYRPAYSSSVPFSSGDFEQKNADPGWDGPAAPGQYKITVDFITGKYKIEAI